MTAAPDRLFQQPWPEGEYRLFQLGFVVEDIIPAARRWATVLGVGPFHVLPPNEVVCTYYGNPAGLSLQVAVAQAGPVQIELIQQHGEGESVFREGGRLRTGFHQVCTVTREYDRKRVHYEGLGYEIACEIVAPDGQRVAFVDTVDDFGFFTEVVEETPRFLRQLAGIAGTCADWDGTDPVRLLTRTGYDVP